MTDPVWDKYPAPDFDEVDGYFEVLKSLIGQVPEGAQEQVYGQIIISSERSAGDEYGAKVRIDQSDAI